MPIDVYHPRKHNPLHAKHYKHNISDLTTTFTRENLNLQLTNFVYISQTLGFFRWDYAQARGSCPPDLKKLNIIYHSYRGYRFK